MVAAFRLLIPLILAPLLTQVAEALPPEQALPAVPRAVVVRADAVLACMAQEGVAVVSIDPGTSTGLRLEAVVRIPALHGVFLEDTRVLLAGREGFLMVLDLADRSAPKVRECWPQEGIPVHVALEGVRLFVAAGPAGVQVLDWPDSSAAPVLRGRYAFCDFVKQTAFGPTGALFLADNMDGGVQAIEVSDSERPRRLFGTTVGDFIDSIAVSDGVVVAGARRQGWYLFDGSGADRDPLGMVPLPPVRGAEAEAVAPLPGRRAVLAERAAGARAVRLGPPGDPASVTVESRIEGFAVVSVAALPDGRVLLGTEGPGLRLWDPKGSPAGS